MIRIIGNHVSPYARKVFVILAMKGLEFEVDPIVPFFGAEAFTALSPLRRIPVLVDGDLVLCDSTVIAEYLDEAYPEPAMMPRAPADRARARWIEEFADGRLGDVIIWRLFQHRVIKPGVWREPGDEAIIARAIEELADCCDWLEREAPAADFLFGDQATIADTTLGCFFRNALLSNWSFDAARWPKLTRWVGAVHALPAFAATIPVEQAFMTTRRADRAAAFEALGLRIVAQSVGGDVPRRGVMPI